MYVLGNLYVIGTLCPRDEAKGIRYLRAAARRGHRDAQEVLLKDLRVGW